MTIQEGKLNTLQKLYIGFFAGMLLIALNFFRSHLGGHGLDLPFNAMTWIFASGMIAVALWQIGSAQQFIYNKAVMYAGLGVLLLWAPMLYPNQEVGQYALGRLTGLTAGWLIMLSLLQMKLDDSHWQKFLWILTIGAFIYAIGALLLFYGFLDHLIKLKGNNAAGIFAQRNTASSFLVFGLAAVFWQMTQTKQFVKWQLILVTTATIAFSWLIAINVSRSGHIGLFSVLLMTAPLLYKTADKTALRWVYLAVIIGMAMPHIVSMFSSYESAVRDNLPTGPRITMYTVSLRLFLENPLMGWGYGAFDPVYHLAQARLYAEDPSIGYMLNVGHPHNELALWGVEGGILPIIVFAGLALYIVRLFFQSDWRKGLFQFGLIFPVLFHSMVEYPFYHAAILWILLCLFLAKAVSEDQPLSTVNFPSKFAPQLFSILLVLTTSIYMMMSIQAVKQIVRYERSNLTDIKQLEDIISPISQMTRYGSYINNIRLILGIKTNRKEDIQAYIDWNNQTRKHMVRAKFYHNHIIALRALGEEEQAAALYQQAKKLFIKHMLFEKYPEFLSNTKSASSPGKVNLPGNEK